MKANRVGLPKIPSISYIIGSLMLVQASLRDFPNAQLETVSERSRKIVMHIEDVIILLRQHDKLSRERKAK